MLARIFEMFSFDAFCAGCVQYYQALFSTGLIPVASPGDEQCSGSLSGEHFAEADSYHADEAHRSVIDIVSGMSATVIAR